MEYKPTSGLNRVVRALLMCKIGLLSIAVLSGAYLYFSYRQLPADTDISEIFLRAEKIDAVVGITQVVFGGALIGIVYLVWLYRINKNLHALEPRQMEFTPGWAVGWYFVPIANLFKPYQVMREIWNVAHGTRHASPGLVSFWWGLWILSAVLAKIAFRVSLRAQSLSDQQISTLIYILSDYIDIVLNVVVLMMIGRIWEAYRDRREQSSAAGAASEPTPASAAGGW